MSLRVLFHLAVSWVLFLLAFALVWGSVYLVIRSSISESAALPTDGWAMLGIAAIGIGSAVGLAYGSVHLFVRLWFSYLSRLPTHERLTVEGKLPTVMNIAVMQPLYNKVRSRYFPNDA